MPLPLHEPFFLCLGMLVEGSEGPVPMAHIDLCNTVSILCIAPTLPGLSNVQVRGCFFFIAIQIP